MSGAMYPLAKPRKLYYGFSTITKKWVVMDSKPSFLIDVTVFSPNKKVKRGKK